MNVSLTPELDHFVQQKVETGMYLSASEVIREGLRLLIEQDQLKKAHLDLLRRDVDLGISQIEQGQYGEYSVETLSTLADGVKASGRRLLETHNGQRQ